MRQESPVRHDVASVISERNEKTMLNVKVTRLQPVVSQNANKLRAIADIEIGNGLMIYGLLYKLNNDN